MNTHKQTLQYRHAARVNRSRLRHRRTQRKGDAHTHTRAGERAGLADGVCEVLLGAGDGGDAHERVVDGDAEVVHLEHARAHARARARARARTYTHTNIRINTSTPTSTSLIATQKLYTRHPHPHTHMHTPTLFDQFDRFMTR